MRALTAILFVASLASCSESVAKTGQTYHVIEINGIENFADHTISIDTPVYKINDGHLTSWSKRNDIESGSLQGPGSMPPSISITLNYQSTTYTNTFTIPESCINKQALYRLSWNIADNTHEWHYASLEWQFSGYVVEASFDKAGTISQLSVQEGTRDQRKVWRYDVIDGIPTMTFVALINHPNPIVWVTLGDDGRPVKFYIPGQKKGQGMELRVNDMGVIQSAFNKPVHDTDTLVPIDITEDMKALIPPASSYAPPAIDIIAAVHEANLQLVQELAPTSP